MNFLKSNFWEIERSPMLNYFGAILSVLHFINYFYWRSLSHFLNSESARPLLCWEFFSSCTSATGIFSHRSLLTLFMFYLIFSVLAFTFFVWRRFIRASWLFLLGSTFIALLFYVYDASLSQDIHALFFFLNLIFLFCPNKSPLIRFSVITFYLISGYRELNPEWLSGAALHKAMPYSFKVLEWIAAFSIGIKMTLPFLLVSPIGQRLALAVCGLTLTHSFYFYYFHDFSSLALGLLSFYFVIEFFERKRLEREAMYQSYAHPEPSKLWWPLVASIFIFAQTPMAAPTVFFDLFKIYGPAVFYECEHINFAKYKNKIEFIDSELTESGNAKVTCHPLVAFNSAKEACRSRKSDPDFISISSYFIKRKFSELNYENVFSNLNICLESVTYSNVRSK